MNDERRTMNEESGKPMELKARMREYALRVIRMYCALPKKDDVAHVLGHQALRSGTSAGAQHREAMRARSNAEFISKMESALQELEETDYWLDLLVVSGILSEKLMRDLIAETNELIAILVSSVKTVKARQKRKG
jgi:four helix bundle protein